MVTRGFSSSKIVEKFYCLLVRVHVELPVEKQILKLTVTEHSFYVQITVFQTLKWRLSIFILKVMQAEMHRCSCFLSVAEALKGQYYQL